MCQYIHTQWVTIQAPSDSGSIRDSTKRLKRSSHCQSFQDIRILKVSKKKLHFIESKVTDVKKNIPLIRRYINFKIYILGQQNQKSSGEWGVERILRSWWELYYEGLFTDIAIWISVNTAETFITMPGLIMKLLSKDFFVINIRWKSKEENYLRERPMKRQILAVSIWTGMRWGTAPFV